MTHSRCMFVTKAILTKSGLDPIKGTRSIFNNRNMLKQIAYDYLLSYFILSTYP